MSTLNVKVPDEMDEDIEAFLEANPHYLNKSELVRDAVRHLIEHPRLSDRTLEDDRVSRQQIDDADVTALEDV
jgi:Arc/MetJ-type ribon-helix-helix transcriptional regulator